MQVLHDIATRFSALPQSQQHKFLAALKAQKIDFASLPIVAAPKDKAPLGSYAQARQWFLWQLDPHSSAYHISGALKLTGTLNVALLKTCFEKLVARHEALRTCFQVNHEGQLEQSILASGGLQFEHIDLTMIDTVERDHSIRQEAEALQQTPFDLTTGPLLRVGLIECSAHEFILVVVMHHIISDGWSMQVIVNEFVALYRALDQGISDPLKPLPIQYSDYAVWQRNWLEAGEKERQLSYWREQLGTEQPTLQLPIDFARNKDGHYTASRYELDLPEALITKLRQSVRAENATLFMGLLASFQVLLHRYTGQDDIRVGVPVANRHREETEGLVGFFVNTQVLRLCLDGRTPLVQVLARVREAAQGAQAHQDLPFEQLVEALQPQRNLGINPLFQVAYNHQRRDQKALESLPNLTLEQHSLGEQSAQFDLMLDSAEREDGRVSLVFTYAKELFDPETIERMAGHYQAILEALAQQPEQCVAEVDLLNEAERQQLMLWSVNPEHYANPEYRADAMKPVHQLIEQQALASPDNTALMFARQTLSYAELNRRANQVAHYLIAQGVQPETKVGIALERSIDMVVGLLGILKAGAAYVPLDPEYPVERLAYMVQDSGLQYLLTYSDLSQRHFIDSLSLPTLKNVMAFDEQNWHEYPSHNPNIVLHDDNLAYVIYTSGSTGQPKGVAVRHVALSNLLMHMQQTLDVSAQDTLLAVTSLSFDISGLEIYLPLISAAKVVIATRADSRDGSALAHLLEQHQVTLLQCTPASWRLLLHSNGLKKEAGAQPLVGLCGGEALPTDLANELIGKGVSLWNVYGPTETTIWSTMRAITGPVELGKAITATELRVLDDALNQVPIGVAGELYIGGAGIARGYLGRAALSAERFIANPFESASPFDNDGTRLYRTGDLVRWNAAGQLEYLGRIDHQVKVRGFRIELGEIETQLLALPMISDAVVTAQPVMTSSGSNGDQLVAYVCAQGDFVIDSAALRYQLRERLPDYMVPSAFVVLDRLPLNNSGKVDRNVLPKPELTATAEYQAPQGELEIALAEIWAEVLGVEKVGRQDSFFELGGYSLQAAQLSGRVQQALQLDLTIQDVFAQQTLMDMATLLASKPNREDISQSLSSIDDFIDCLEAI